MVSLYEFYQAVEKRVKTTSERKGQAASNILYTVRPDLHKQVTLDMDMDKDPFYVEANWDRFVKFIEANWYN